METNFIPCPRIIVAKSTQIRGYCLITRIVYFCNDLMLLLSRTMSIPKEAEFTTSSLWTWFLRIMMGVVSFLLISLYQDLKTLIVNINDMKIMMAEQKKDIEYLKDGYYEFKQETKGKITKLEDTK